MVDFFKAFENCVPGQEITTRDGTACLIEVYMKAKQHVWVIDLTKERLEEVPIWNFTGIFEAETIPILGFEFSFILSFRMYFPGR